MLMIGLLNKRLQRWTPNAITAAYDCSRCICALIVTGLIISTYEAHATVGYYSHYVNIYSLTIQPNGKIIVSGQARAGDHLYRYFLVRLNIDGSLDLEFDQSIEQPADVIALQPDGKILVALRRYNAPDKLIRFHFDGSVDNSFSSESYLSIIHDIAALSNGKILIGGDNSTSETEHQNAIYRLNADGSIDTTFKAEVGLRNASSKRPSVETIVIQHDENILIGGRFNILNRQPHTQIGRLHNHGGLDMAFNSDINHPDASKVMRMAMQPDGKILVSGRYMDDDNVFYTYLFRLNSDGSKDATFDSFIKGGDVFSMDVQPDGKILVSGVMLYLPDDQGINNIIRMNHDGSQDISFKISTENVVNSIAIQSDGKIIVGGNLHYLITDENLAYLADTNGYEVVYGLARLNDDGSVDETFKPWTDNLIKSINSSNSSN